MKKDEKKIIEVVVQEDGTPLVIYDDGTTEVPELIKKNVRISKEEMKKGRVVKVTEVN